jgi:transposase-like protein
MRLPASEKLEIIGLGRAIASAARRTLQMLGIKPSTFYRWYDRYRSGGPEALEQCLLDRALAPPVAFDTRPFQLVHLHDLPFAFQSARTNFRVGVGLRA